MRSCGQGLQALLLIVGYQWLPRAATAQCRDMGHDSPGNRSKPREFTPRLSNAYVIKTLRIKYEENGDVITNRCMPVLSILSNVNLSDSTRLNINGFCPLSALMARASPTYSQRILNSAGWPKVPQCKLGYPSRPRILSVFLVVVLGGQKIKKLPVYLLSSKVR
jgi:hypothetical protein